MIKQLLFGRRGGVPEVDLHTHSVHSDGSETPTELVHRALKLKLAALALTDHDTTAGLAEARRAAAGTPLEIVPGVELSASEGRSDVHILVYDHDQGGKDLEGELRRFREARERRAVCIVEKLNQLGVEITMDDVRSMSGPGSIGRPHIAGALVLRGHVDHPQEAFRKYLGHGCKAWVPKEELTPEDALALARHHGGRAVLAHPGTLRRDDLIPTLKEHGLVGLEAWHPRHDEGTTRHYLEMARRLDLVATGGSDFHGSRNPGVALGAARVPADVLLRLRAVAVA